MTRRIITGLLLLCSCVFAQQPFIDDFPRGFEMQTNTLWTQVYQSMRDVVRGDLHNSDLVPPYYPWQSWFISSTQATNRTATFRPHEYDSQRTNTWIGFDHGIVLASGFDRTPDGYSNKNFTNQWAKNPYIGWHFRESQLWLERLAPRYGQLSGESTNLTYEPFGTWTNLANIAGLTSNDWRRATTNYPGMTNIVVIDFEGEYTDGINTFDPTGRYFYDPNPDGDAFWGSDSLLYYFGFEDGDYWKLWNTSIFEIIATNAAGPFGTYTAADGFSGVGVATETIIRTIPDPEWDQWEYGRSVTGDIIGPWLFEDITKGVDAMHISHYNQTILPPDGTPPLEAPMFSYAVGLEWSREYTNKWLLGVADMPVPYIVRFSENPDLDGLYHDRGGYGTNFVGIQFYPSGKYGVISKQDNDWYIHDYQSFVSVSGPADHPAVGRYRTDGMMPPVVIEVLYGYELAHEDSATDWVLSARRDGAGYEVWAPSMPSLHVVDSGIEDADGAYMQVSGGNPYPLEYFYETTNTNSNWAIQYQYIDDDEHFVWWLSDLNANYALFVEQEVGGSPDGASGVYYLQTLPSNNDYGFQLMTNGVQDTWEIWPPGNEYIELSGDPTNVSPSTAIGRYVHVGENRWEGPSNWIIDVVDGEDAVFGVFPTPLTSRAFTNAYFFLPSPIYRTHEHDRFPSLGYAPAGSWDNVQIEAIPRSTGDVYSALSLWMNSEGPAGTYEPYAQSLYPSNATPAVISNLFAEVPPVFELRETNGIPVGVYDPLPYTPATNSIEVIRSGYVRDPGTYWGNYTAIGVYTNDLRVNVDYYQLLDPITPFWSDFGPVDIAEGWPYIEDGAMVILGTNDWSYVDDSLLTIEGSMAATAELDPLTPAVMAARDAAMTAPYTIRDYLTLEPYSEPGYRYFAAMGYEAIINEDWDADIDWSDFDIEDVRPFMRVYARYDETEAVRVNLIADRTIENRGGEYGAGGRYDLPFPTNVYIELEFQSGHPLHTDPPTRFLREVDRNRLYAETASWLGDPFRDPRTERMMGWPGNALESLAPLPIRPVDSPMTNFNYQLGRVRTNGWWFDYYTWADDFTYSENIDCPIKRYIIEWTRKYRRP
jgi:hypothetical protein